MTELNEYGLDPMVLEMYKALLNLPSDTQLTRSASPVVPAAPVPPDAGTSILQRLKERILGPMTQGMGNAISAGVPVIPAYKLYQQFIGKPFTENIVAPVASDLKYVLTGQEPEGQVPSTTGPDVTPPPTPIPSTLIPKPTIPFKKPVPKAPTGEQIGTPQWTSPPGQGIAPESTPPGDLADRDSTSAEASASTETPVSTAPTSAAEIPDFNKLIQPQKTQTDYEKSMMDIFNEVVPKWQDLPQAKSIEGKTPTDVLARFARDVGLSMLHKDIFALKKGEEADAEAKANQERNYVIQRASQLANFKISVLDQKMKKEEGDRESKAKWLEYVGNANPEYRKNPSYQAAVASIRGIPVEQAAPLLQSMVDPKTGLLEGMYERPEERAIKQQEAMNNWNVKRLVELGLSPEGAKRAAAGIDMGPILMDKLQVAMQSKNPDVITKAKQDLQTYQKMMTFDPMEEKAISFLENKNLMKKSGLFADDASYKAAVDWATKYMFLGKDAAKDLKMPAPEHITFNEGVARFAGSALGNPAREKAFFDKYGMTAQTAFQIHYSGLKEGAPLPADMPEPARTIAGWYKDATKNPEKFMGMDDIGTNNKKAATIQIANKYQPWLDQIRRGDIIADPKDKAVLIKNMQKKPLTDDELYRFATAVQSQNQLATQEIVRQICADRGVTFKP